MTFAAERDRRQTAGNRLKRLLEQQEDPDDEFYGTAYGGFLDEEEDNDYDSEDSEEDVVDSDFDQEDEQQQQQQVNGEQGSADTEKKRDDDEDSGDEETDRRKRKKVVYQAQSLQQELKAQRKERSTSTKQQQHHKAHTSKTEGKTLRNSTSVKRVELEKRQKERQERRAHLKGVASLRNTREVRKLTQEELLEEAKITEEINLEALEAYQQIELKKKEIKRMKLTQECPRICTSSMTILNDLIDDSYQLESLPERCSRTFVSFTHLQTYNETFSKSTPTHRQPQRRICPITGMPAQYFDLLTQMPYATVEAFKILRRIYAEEMKKQKRTASVLIDAQRDVNLNNLR